MGNFTSSGSRGTRMTKTVSIMKRCVEIKLEVKSDRLISVSLFGSNQTFQYISKKK